MPVPSAVISVPICSDDSILSKRARSTLRILPRSGSTAWNSRSRPCLAEPPAELPSTRKQLGLGRIALLAVGELAGQRGDVEPFLRVSSRALRAASRAAAASTTLPTITLASLGCSSNQALSASLITPSTTGRTSDETSLSLVCDENFGSGTFTDSTAVRPSRQSSPVSVDLLLAGARRLLGVAGDLARQRAAEAGEVRAAVALRDVVGEAEHVLVVAVVPPQRTLDADAVALGLDDDRLRHQRRLVAVEVFDECLDAALVAHLLALLDRVALVGEHDADARVEERELAQAMLERREIELDHREGLGRRQERHLGAALVRPRRRRL